MNECSTNQTQHFSGCAALAASGVQVKHLKLFDPIRTTVQIRQKTTKHTPADKLYDAFISPLAGAHGLVEINTRLRTDPAWQQAFGRRACAEQPVAQQILDACTTDHVTQLQHALDEICRQQSQSVHYDYRANFLLWEVDKDPGGFWIGLVQVLTGRSASGFSHANAMICMNCSNVKVAGAPRRCSSARRTSIACLSRFGLPVASMASKRDWAALQRSRHNRTVS